MVSLDGILIETKKSLLYFFLVLSLFVVVSLNPSLYMTGYIDNYSLELWRIPVSQLLGSKVHEDDRQGFGSHPPLENLP